MIWKHNILILFGALLTALFASGCTADSSAAPEPEVKGSATIGISIGLSAPTRSAADGEFELGTGFENYLDIDNGNYRIYFFDYDNNTFVSTFETFYRPVFSSVPDRVNGVDTYYYTFMGAVPLNLGLKFKIVVLANWTNYPVEATQSSDTGFVLVKGETTIEDLCTHADAQFAALTNDGGDWLAENRLIPFYGVRGYDLSTIDDAREYIKDGKIEGDVYIDLQKAELALPLLRAMARIEVILDNPLASFSSVRMTRINSKGYCAPYSSSSDWKFDYDDYFHGYDWETDFTRHLHLPDGKNDATASGLEFKKMTDAGTAAEKWVAYVPEYLNTGDDYTTIDVTLARPDDVAETEWKNPVRTIHFAPGGIAASPETRYNIERNNIYRFTVSVMTASITCKVDIQPYTEKILTPDYGLQRDSRGDLMIPVDRDAQGKEVLPQYFLDFMEGKEWPTDYTTGDHLVARTGDYYSIILPENGTISQSEVWLKDSDGFRVMTNLAARTSGSAAPEDTQDCNTREVVMFFGLEQITFYKDTQGERRLWHYSNHWSIVYDNEGRTILKSDTRDGASQVRYIVESWTESQGTYGESDYVPGECWIVESEEENTALNTITYKYRLFEDGKKVENNESGLKTVVVNASTGEPIN